jgi:Asp/Glu/hydantoin racemase
MTQTLAIIHTTAVTVAPLKELAGELLPGTKVINFVDDSILPQLLENGAEVAAVTPRLLQYSRFAQEVGADIILNACSSVGGVVAEMRRAVSIPVVRIDEAMAEEAVKKAQHIGVAATLPTTLKPTLALLEAKAVARGKKVRLESVCASAAYERLLAGDVEGHDKLLAETLYELAERVERVVLAQASMARVLGNLPQTLQAKFLSSPRLGMQAVKAALKEKVER